MESSKSLTQKSACVLSLALLISSSNMMTKGYSYAGGFPDTPAYKAPISEQKSDALVEESLPGSKPLMQIKRGDMELTFGGATKFETFFAKNVVMLNNNIPDEYGYFRQTIDFTTDLAFGEKYYGHKALELFVDIRQKNIWGATGKAIPTTKDTIKFADTVGSSHSHKNTKPLLWFRDAWMKASLNAIFNKKQETQHYIKFGFFPYYVGRGISYGPVYGVAKEFLGIYSGYQSDQSAPAIMLTGEVMKDRLSYDLYYAKLEEMSSGLGETFNHVKSNLVGRSATPYRGVAKDNDLFIIHLKWNALKKGDKHGELEFEPYYLFNDASDRSVEFEADAKMELSTVGAAVEYKNKNFEWGAESAFNFGQQRVHHLDRNVIQVARDSNGNLIERYSHVITDPNTATSFAPVTDATKTTVEANKANTVNSAFIANDGTTDLYNTSNRFRPAYQNQFGGWMFVTDIAYKLDDADLKVAAAYGFASGDKNPNASTREFDKKYHGFIGLQEWYSGKRVPSVLVLDARKLKRPLTLKNDDRSAGDDASFTDMHYFGIGTTWFPIEHNQDKFHIQSNTIFFWKDEKSNAWNRKLNVASADKANRFLGLEWNLRVRHQMLNDFFIFGDFAVFFPGGFYDDVRGTPLSGDVFSNLDETDKSGVDSSNYRLGNDTAFYFNFGVTYKF